MLAKQRRGMKECWEELSLECQWGLRSKLREDYRMWEGSDVWISGEQLGVVGWWVVVW